MSVCVCVCEREREREREREGEGERDVWKEGERGEREKKERGNGERAREREPRSSVNPFLFSSLRRQLPLWRPFPSQSSFLVSSVERSREEQQLVSRMEGRKR